MTKLLGGRSGATIPVVGGAGAGRGDWLGQLLLLGLQVLLGLLQGEVAALHPDFAARVHAVAAHGTLLWGEVGDILSLLPSWVSEDVSKSPHRSKQGPSFYLHLQRPIWFPKGRQGMGIYLFPTVSHPLLPSLAASQPDCRGALYFQTGDMSEEQAPPPRKKDVLPTTTSYQVSRRNQLLVNSGEGWGKGHLQKPEA